ncbi:Glycosyltransferase involved in cell wall bisynthesis [Cupriavidus sp. YR651]|uniref:glycosyltransferase family 4 protein n=1 Tax=Cupriavidus sp. YR651 TaxID=1855315 RepID=UPI000892592A|nr:glycosyltransferase family 4 protein [Cupriavidus sp. YR651]SDC21769.1 Glycosyltransferase involved in cell wall bisynthesis [Cupriavidus sp. YR651]
MNKLPTVCFLTGTLNAFAGAERMTAVIANALAERGYRVLVLSLWDRASVFPLHADVEHHALFDERPSFKRKYVSTVRGIRRFVREHGVEVLIEVDTMLTLFTLPATLGLKMRRIAWEHCHFDEDLGRRARRVARWLAGRFNSAAVVLTERDRQRWLQQLHPRCEVHAIANPLPFPFPADAASGHTQRVLSVGRLTHAKGFDVLLQAWSEVAASCPGWSLQIVGDGEEREPLESMIRELGLGESVSMPGTSRNVEQFYRDASIFCLSSRYEGFGLVLVEAMSFGLGVVSTDCEAGPREILRHGENAWIAPADDASALARALTQLMRDEILREKLAEQARADARAFSLKAIETRWDELLTTVPTTRDVAQKRWISPPDRGQTQ